MINDKDSNDGTTNEPELDGATAQDDGAVSDDDLDSAAGAGMRA